MTKEETIQVLQSIEDRAVDFPHMTACDWVAIAAAKRHLENSIEVKEVDLEKEYEEFVVNDPVYNKLANGIVGKAIAKHFFELGLKARTDKELVKEIYSHIDSIKDTADRMTSGNFMHSRAAIKLSANTIAKVLELIGLKAQKRE